MRRLLLATLVFFSFGCSEDDASRSAVPAEDASVSEDVGLSDAPFDPGVHRPDLGSPDTGIPVDMGPIVWDPEPGPPPMTFAHGVASGDPLEDRVILWTRVSPSMSPSNIDVRWQVATGPDFREVVADGIFSTTPQRDYTVKVDAIGLSPGHTYWYRFEAEGVQSPIGRTKTLPGGPLARVRFAVASCAHFEVGFFNVYRLIARRRTPTDDLDAVIHLGDYFYEYGATEYGNGVTGREVRPTTETITLQDYRIRHALYKTDLDLQEMHASHPVIAVWDDHESANDAWKDGAQNHDPRTEGSWSDRKRAAVQAYYEWMPVRDPTMGGRLFRRFVYGELVTLHMLDTRLEARDRQFDLGELITNPRRLVDALLDEDRTMLGQAQEQWLTEGLVLSPTTWQLLGNQVMMGQLYAPVIPDIPDLSDAARAQIAVIRLLAELADSAIARFLPGPGLPVNVDAWDGYIPARSRLLETLARVNNVVVLTGDFHNGWALDLARDADLKNGGSYDPTSGAGALAVEFVTPSVTSPGFEGTLPDATLGLVRNLLLDKNRHIKWANLKDRGFMLVTLTSDQVEVRYILSPNIRVSSPAQTLGPRFLVRAGERRIRGPL